jgi:citrate lyase beta subunit
MNPTLSSAQIEAAMGPLRESNARFARTYPGDTWERQPVQTVYGGAQLFQADTTVKLGQLALKALETYAPHFGILARAVGLTGAETLPESWQELEQLRQQLEADPQGTKRIMPHAWRAWTVYNRVLEKLQREPVEDFRIDFEDGYGNRPDAEEDKDAVRTAQEVAKGAKAGTLPPFIGIRVKPLTDQLFARSVRTLDLFLSTLVAETGGQLPSQFIVTLPKVTAPEQVTAFVQLIAALEEKLGLSAGAVPIELMVETTQSIMDSDGLLMLPLLVKASAGRCRGAHFGTYDYTASCNIIARYQSMVHPACDYARSAMQVALASTGIMLSDGATNIMPVPVHRGEGLNLIQQQENLKAVHAAWHLHFEHIQHSLSHALYQGWDLHPAQLITRYAAVFDFFLRDLDAATVRLNNFVAKAAQATLSGDVFDDAATGRGLLNYFRLAYNCNAVTEAEIEAAGVSRSDLRGEGSGTSPWLDVLNR